MTIMEHVNGKGQRGRIAPPLPQHTFQDSGITIGVRKIGPNTQQRLAQQIARELPEPPIPIIATELGNEPNAADPDYMAAYAKWEIATNSELTRRLMRIAALEAEVTIDDHARAEMARKKRSLELAGIPWIDDSAMTDAENERVFYILEIAAATPEDLGEFGNAVMHRSVPTEAAVERQIATFSSDLSG